jgi:hypothetical protein
MIDWHNAAAVPIGPSLRAHALQLLNAVDGFSSPIAQRALYEAAHLLIVACVAECNVRAKEVTSHGE